MSGPITTRTGMFRGNAISSQTIADVQGLLTSAASVLGDYTSGTNAAAQSADDAAQSAVQAAQSAASAVGAVVAAVPAAPGKILMGSATAGQVVPVGLGAGLSVSIVAGQPVLVVSGGTSTGSGGSAGSGSSGAPVATVSSLSLTAASAPSGAPGTVLAQLVPAVSNGPLVNPVVSIKTDPSSFFQIINGDRLSYLSDNPAVGDYTITLQVAADNLATAFTQYLHFGVTAAALPPLTGIDWHQPSAINQDAGDYALVGWMDPIGGIGPYTYSVAAAAGSNANYKIVPTETFEPGAVAVDYYAPGSRSGAIVLSITDGRGVTVTRQVTVDVSTAPAPIGDVITCNRRTPIYSRCLTSTYSGPVLRTDFQGSRDIGVTGTGWQFDSDNHWVRWSNPNNTSIPPGTYPLTFQFVTSDSVAHTLSYAAVVADKPFASFIELALVGSVNTAMTPGTAVGKVLATTPLNSPQFSMVDPSGYFQMDAAGHITIKAMPASGGSLPVAVTVTEGGRSYTQSVTIPVQAGTVLPAANMTMSVPSTLTNDTYDNVIGTPVVTGMTGPITWSLVSQSHCNPYIIAAGAPALFQMPDSTTGRVIAPAIMSADPDLTSPRNYTVTLSATSGSSVCTQTFTIPVAWAPVSKTVYVGPGQSTLHPTTDSVVGLETGDAFRDFMVGRHAGTYHVLWYPNADRDHYANDDGTATADYSARFSIQGPVIIEGVNGGAGMEKPRVGGFDSNTLPGGQDMRSKGFFTFGDGDAGLINFEISGGHDQYNDGTHGIEAVRMDGQTNGNVTLKACYIHDNDNGVLSGFKHGTLLLDGCLIVRGGSSHNSSGLDHNTYAGEIYWLLVMNCVFINGNQGHLLKCRALGSTIHNSLFLEGLGGNASALIEFPNGGAHEVYNCVLVKGPMAMGPDAIRYGAEGYAYDDLRLNVHDNTILVFTNDGNHYSPASAMSVFGGNGPNGHSTATATATFTNNKVWLNTGVNKFNLYNGAPSSCITETGTTMLTSIPAISLVRPDLPGGLPLPAIKSPMYRQQSQDDFNNFYGASQIADRHEIRVSASAGAGTVLANLVASNDGGAQGPTASGGDAAPNPFDANTTWSLVRDATFWGLAPWAADGLFTIEADSNGHGVLKLGTGAAAGVYTVQARATASNGTIPLKKAACFDIGSADSLGFS